MTLRQIVSLAAIGSTIAFVLTLEIAFAIVMIGHSGDGLAAQFLYLVFFNPRGSLCVCVGMAIAVSVLIYDETF